MSPDTNQSSPAITTKRASTTGIRVPFAEREAHWKLVLAGFLLAALITACASVPPEFGTSMQREAEGIAFLQTRHQESVRQLAEFWYEERLARLDDMRTAELAKVTIDLPNPDGGDPLMAVALHAMNEIGAQYAAAVAEAEQARLDLLSGYSDADNWQRLVKIHSANQSMAYSLLELDRAQRAFYSEIVGDNIPFPKDFINENVMEALNPRPR
ncbi:MAG: hypothetical protein OXJ90_25045 [Spirochaetaceae bacterium]|nr:hypothetical protein [Spirochaetaceae bacterium]